MTDQEKIQRLTEALTKAVATFKDLHMALTIFQKHKAAEACAVAAGALEEDLKEVQA